MADGQGFQPLVTLPVNCFRPPSPHTRGLTTAGYRLPGRDDGAEAMAEPSTNQVQHLSEGPAPSSAASKPRLDFD
jgi:hypothetical protein